MNMMRSERTPELLRQLFVLFPVAMLLATTPGEGPGIAYAGDESSRGRGTRPNIVFLFADDLGWTDLGSFGSEYYETPNIDRLCREGMKFTNAYANAPNCAPTRACLLSGRYTPRHGVYTVSTGARGEERNRKMIPVQNRTDLPHSEVTFAEALRSAGYATGCFGKWHLGKSEQFAPTTQGFDEWAFRSREHPHPATDYVTERAIEFIRKNAERPFFTYLPYHAVHTPIKAPKHLIEKYSSKKPVGGHDDPVYAAMLEELDLAIGRVLQTLDELELTEKTMVVFFSDNGGMGGYERAGITGGERFAGNDITDNAPLHGGKGMLYEGGIRVPLIVRCPGVVEPGSQCREPVIGIDFYPTFLDLTDSDGDPNHQLDGKSLMPLLMSSGSASLNRDALYWHFPGYLQAAQDGSSWRTTPAGAIRSGDYKLIEFFETGRIELYDLNEDLGEMVDLKARMPRRAAQLHDKLVAWRKTVRAPMPIQKPHLGE
jgi:arylsulfatase A-like enzyme